MFIRILILFYLLIPSNNITNKRDVEIKDIEESQRFYLLNKDSVEFYPVSEVMAAIAYHECYNLTQEERFLVMEAFLNRVEDNFNQNGNTVKEQLLAPKQFTGLWKYNPQQFKYDSSDSLCIQNREMAEAIISGYRISSRRIFFWAGISDRKTAHGKWVKKDKIKTSSNVKHWFR
jgi:hypothetical protein